jgi:predicted acetyltransferase
MTSKYEFRSFPAVVAEGRADEATAEWLQATSLGFLEPEFEAEQLGKIATSWADSKRILSGAYALQAPSRAWPSIRPVATYSAYDKTMNVGGGRLIDTHLVAGVTVRANHRRRGLMRTLIETDLRTAATSGIPIAALYAAEATIYGRFGFAAATTTARVEVDTSSKFGLNLEPRGSVDAADRSELAEVSPLIFARYHALTLGSIDREAYMPAQIAGLWGYDPPDPDPAVRGLFHYDDAGELDGYVSYKFLGWDDGPRTLLIIDFVPLTGDAYFGLWQHLASIDLATRVKVEHAPITDPLPWALRDRRSYRVTGGEDGLWLRILDVVAALQARAYVVDGDVSLAIDDPLHLTTGHYRVIARDGTARVERTEPSSSVTLGIAELGALYLGGVRASSLAIAGRLTGPPEGIAALDALMATRVEPFCNTHF